MLCSRFSLELSCHDAARHQIEKFYLHSKPINYRKSIDGRAALVELDIKVTVSDLILFALLYKPLNRMKILDWERTCFSSD